MNPFEFLTTALAPVVAAIGGGILAAGFGLPQGLGFETALVFEVLTVAVAAVVLPTVMVAFGVQAVREERARRAADPDLMRRMLVGRGGE
jgi:hypothetical protein